MSTKNAAFQAIKKVFITVLILLNFDLNKECIVETDVSNYVSAAVLSQPDHKSIVWFVAFLSCQHLLAKCNYEIYNKELLAIVWAFKKWRLELKRLLQLINNISDCKNLKYFIFS